MPDIKVVPPMGKFEKTVRYHETVIRKIFKLEKYIGSYYPGSDGSLNRLFDKLNTIVLTELGRRHEREF